MSLQSFFQIKKSAFLILLVMLGACHNNNSVSRSVDLAEEEPMDADAIAQQWMKTTRQTTSNTTSRETFRLVADDYRFTLMDGPGISVNFKRLFPLREVRRNGSILDSADDVYLGTYNLSVHNAAERVILPTVDLQQKYIKTLRDFLAGACAEQIEHELELWENDEDAARSEAVFLKRLSVPRERDISNLMAMYFGLVPVSGQLIDGSAAYHSLISGAVEGRTVGSEAYLEALSEAMVLFCISAGSELRAFAR